MPAPNPAAGPRFSSSRTICTEASRSASSKPSAAVDNDNDPVRGKALVLEKAADDIPGQTGPTVGQDDCGHAQGVEIASFVRHADEP